MATLKVLILAAKPVGHGQIFTGELESPLLIPFQGKPLVMHFENQFKDFDIFYALGGGTFKTQSFIGKRFRESSFITVPEEVLIGTPGDCLLHCLEQLNFPDNILTIHGDNIYEFKDYPTLMDKNINYFYETESRDGKYEYYPTIGERNDDSKTRSKKSTNWVNTGAHFIKVSGSIDRTKGVLINDLLRDADFIGLNKWIDLGHWDLINRNNTLISSRHFNTISLSRDRSSIIKLSTKNKIQREFEHLSNVPPEFSFLFPRVEILSEIKGYKIEYWPLRPLSEYLVFWNLDLLSWAKIFEKILCYIDRFASHTFEIVGLEPNLENIYVKMLDERIQQYSKECLDILNYNFVFLNGFKLKGFAEYSEVLYQDLRRIGNSINPSFYHGDLCLSNILFHPESEIIKLIDPKGSLFPESSNAGDFRYDLAKLFHSIIGEYDYFNSTMFSLLQIENYFTIDLFKQSNSNVLETKFREVMLRFHSKEILRDVEILMAMLFLTMVPLHCDSRERQKALLIQGIKILNHIYLN
jgi:thiamine kinase-like enzyme